MTNPDDHLDRRTVLRGLGAGATLLGTSGLASADPSVSATEELPRTDAMERAADTFASDRATRHALEEFGDPVRTQLAAEGVSVPLDLNAYEEVRTFPDREDGVPTAHIVAIHDDGTREVELHVLPQAEATFAYEDGPDGLRRYDADGSGPTPAKDCSYSSGCTDEVCNCLASEPDCQTNCAYFWEKEHCCLLADGSYECDRVEYYCEEDCRTC